MRQIADGDLHLVTGPGADLQEISAGLVNPHPRLGRLIQGKANLALKTFRAFNDDVQWMTGDHHPHDLIRLWIQTHALIHQVDVEMLAPDQPRANHSPSAAHRPPPLT
jgi:hypothetical protein